MRVLVTVSGINEKNGANALSIRVLEALNALGMQPDIYIMQRSFHKRFLDTLTHRNRYGNSISNLVDRSAYDVALCNFNTTVHDLKKINSKATKCFVTHTGDFGVQSDEWYKFVRDQKITLIAESNEINRILTVNGYDSEKITPPCNEHLLKKYKSKAKVNRNIVAIGSIQRRKNQLLAVKILEQLKLKSALEYKLTLVGNVIDKEYHREIMEYVYARNLQDNIHFTGFLKKYYEKYADHDICLSSSLSEGFATSLREAMYLGKLIIATDIPGNVGQLNKDNAIIFNPEDDVKILANNIIRIVETESASKLARNAETCYRSFYSFEKFKYKLATLCQY